MISSHSKKITLVGSIEEQFVWHEELTQVILQQQMYEVENDERIGECVCVLLFLQSLFESFLLSSLP